MVYFPEMGVYVQDLRSENIVWNTRFLLQLKYRALHELAHMIYLKSVGCFQLFFVHSIVFAK